MFLNLNFAELQALRKRAAGMPFSADQTQACSGVLAVETSRFFNRFFDNGASPGVPMN